MKLQKKNAYNELVNQITDTFQSGRSAALQAVNPVLVNTYWKIGQHIVEFEQGGKAKAGYGKSLINNLSFDLKLSLGRGFSRSNLIYMRLFYLKYPISEKPSHLLSWSHYFELLKIDNDLERKFYEKQSILEKWSVTELKRQKKSSLFLRLAISKDKKGILKIAKDGNIIEQAKDILKEPYVFEFLKIPEPYEISESVLEDALIEHLQNFLLELGKGFTFVGRQHRVTINNIHYKVDLVFYHRYLKCFVLIDLKINELQHNDIGQMNMYLGYFANEENAPDDNEPLGIILTKNKNDVMVEYATYGMNSQLFVKKYQLYLPNEEELRKEIELIYEQHKDEKND